MDNSKLDHPLHLETPLLWSPSLTEKNGMNVWLKLENAQNTGSYKIRGIGKFIQEAVKKGCKHIVSSSGGNAGIAAAYAAKILGIPCTVVVPESTAPFMIEKIRHNATNVEIKGQAWDEANARAMELAKEPGHILVHPFDHPDIWEGHSTMIDEIYRQLEGKKPDAVILSVGGGGLLSGVLKGLYRHGWNDVPIVAMETEGAASFYICVQSGEWKTLDHIDTIAKTLGVKHICKQAFDWIGKHKQLVSRLVTDREAVSACLDFTDDHRFLTSPACGAALAPLYMGTMVNLQKEGFLKKGMIDVVVIVCGGNEVNLKEVDHWKQLFNL